MNVAIDGPAGAGKSTVAKGAAKELGFIYVDTGALYRGIGLHALRSGKNPASAEEVIPLLAGINEEIRFVEGEQRVFLNGEDISGLIRTEEVSKAASDVSAIPEVREFLLEMQKDIAAKNDVIMDGRDIGTVVLPKAELKIFLTAEPEVRAKRRVAQLAEKGIIADFEAVLEDVKKRDYNDSHRAAAPLKQAEDAVLIDNTNSTLEDDIKNIKKLIERAR